MGLNKEEKSIIKLLALVTEMERASDKRFIFQHQFINFVEHLSDYEKEIIETYYEEKEKSDLIAFTLEQGFEIE